MWIDIPFTELSTQLTANVPQTFHVPPIYDQCLTILLSTVSLCMGAANLSFYLQTIKGEGPLYSEIDKVIRQRHWQPTAHVHSNYKKK